MLALPCELGAQRSSSGATAAPVSDGKGRRSVWADGIASDERHVNASDAI